MSTLSTRPLTRRQREILGYLVDRLATGAMPTVREIGEQFDLHSSNAVMGHVKALIKKGYLERDGVKHARSIRPVGVELVLRFTLDEAGQRLQAALTPPAGQEVAP